MHSAFEYPRFEYRRPPEMGASDAGLHPHPLIIVGAGPVGMAAALDARAHGLPGFMCGQPHTGKVGGRDDGYHRRN